MTRRSKATVSAEDNLALALMLLADAYALLRHGDTAHLLTRGGKRQLLRDINSFLERNSEGG